MTHYLVPGFENQTIQSAEIRKLPNYFCRFPLGQHYQHVVAFECGGICLENPMCTGFNFRLYEGEGDIGECITVAPGPDGKALEASDVVNMTEADWGYYGLTRK